MPICLKHRKECNTMSNENEKEIQENEIKLENPFKVMISGDTIVETAQDIIDKDTDSGRRNEFKKAEEIILALEEATKKRKSTRKAKEKEEFEKDLAFTRQNELLRQKQQEQNKERTQEQIDKGMERGE